MSAKSKPSTARHAAGSKIAETWSDTRPTLRISDRRTGRCTGRGRMPGVRSWVTIVGVAVPGLVLAGFGMLHPGYLDASTARAWWSLHVWLIPVFPLISAAVWVLLREERGPLAWLARVAAYAFATFYTGLDVLAGIGAGLVTDVQQGGGPAVGRLFEIGDRLGATGVLALLLSALLTGGLLIRR